jgi:hypothetical protein
MAEQQPAGRNLICQIGHRRASLRTGTGKCFVVCLFGVCVCVGAGVVLFSRFFRAAASYRCFVGFFLPNNFSWIAIKLMFFQGCLQ